MEKAYRAQRGVKLDDKLTQKSGANVFGNLIARFTRFTQMR